MNEPGDLGETFAGTEQAQYLHFTRGQFRKWAPGKGRAGERNAARHRGRQIFSALSDFMDGLDEVMGIAGLRDVALGADLDRAGGEYRIVVHAEHDDTRGGVADENAPREFESRHGRQVDVDHADVGTLGVEGPLAALGVAGLQQHDRGFVGENGAAARRDDRMVIYDQNAHGICLRCVP